MSAPTISRATLLAQQLICAKRARSASGTGGEDATTTKRKKAKEYDAAEQLKRMSILLTGARDGDFLRGDAVSAKGALLRVRLPEGVQSTSISRPILESIRAAGLEDELVGRLMSLRFFRDLGTGGDAAAVRAWLDEHAAEQREVANLKNLIGDGGDLQVFTMGKAQMGDPANWRSAEAAEALMDGGYKTPAEIDNVFAQRTLWQNSGFWSVTEDFGVQPFDEAVAEGPVLDLASGQVLGQRDEPQAGSVVYRVRIPAAAEEDGRADDRRPAAAAGRALRIMADAPRQHMRLERDVRKLLARYPTLMPPDEALGLAPGQKPTDEVRMRAIERALEPIEHLGLGPLKSLVQKLVRFQPRRVALTRADFALALRNGATAGNSVDARLVLHIAVLLTLVHPGTFVPDLQLFTTGLQALTKRMLVILFEDAHVRRFNAATSIALAAFLAQNVPYWRPSLAYAEQWLGLAQQLLGTAAFFNYDRAVGGALPPYTIADQLSVLDEAGAASRRERQAARLRLISALLDSVGSFGGDKDLVRDIVTNYPNQDARWQEGLRSGSPDGGGERPALMPLAHFVDQHASPRFALLMEPSVVAQYTRPQQGTGSAPFAALLGAVFERVTGVNPRRPGHVPPAAAGGLGALEADPFVRSTREAQWAYYARERGDPGLGRLGAPTEAHETSAFRYALQDAHLAGMLGVIATPTVKVDGQRIKTRVMLDPMNVHDFVVMKETTQRSSKKMRDAVLGYAQEAEAAAAAFERLKAPKGMPLYDVPVDAFKGARVRVSPVALPEGADAAAARRALESEATNWQFEVQFARQRGWVAWREAKDGATLLPLLSAFDMGEDDTLPTARQPTAPNRPDYSFGRPAQALLEPPKPMPQQQPAWHPEVLPVPSDAAYKGLVSNYEECAASLLNDLEAAQELDTIRRLAALLSRTQRTLDLPTISRAGGAQAGEALPERSDVAVHAILDHVAALMPSALRRRPKTVGRYTVPYPPLLDYVRDRVTARLAALEEKRRRRYTRGQARQAPGIWPREWLHERGFVLKDFQRRVLDTLEERHARGYAGHFLWMTVGLGKTFTSARYMASLSSRGALPPHVIFTAPKSAMGTVYKELVRFRGLRLRYLVPSAGVRQTRAKQFRGTIPPSAFVEAPELRALDTYTVTLVEHDHLRDRAVQRLLMDAAAEAFVVFDEVHQFLREGTQRTQAGTALALSAKETLAMTGTPIRDGNPETLMPWLAMLVPFEVTQRNFWVAAQAMVAFLGTTDAEVRDELVRLRAGEAFAGDEEARYRALLPARLGGTASNVAQAKLFEAVSLCWRACERSMARDAVDYVLSWQPGGGGVPHGALLVAVNKEGAARLHALLRGLIADAGRERRRAVRWRGDDEEIQAYGVNLEALPNVEPAPGQPLEDVLPPRLLVVPQKADKGYTVTQLNRMYTSVYFSNNATREQLRGRINRLSQRAEKIEYHTYTVGVLENIRRNHEKATSLAAALAELAEDVELGVMADAPAADVLPPPPLADVDRMQVGGRYLYV